MVTLRLQLPAQCRAHCVHYVLLYMRRYTGRLLPAQGRRAAVLGGGRGRLQMLHSLCRMKLGLSARLPGPPLSFLFQGLYWSIRSEKLEWAV